MEKQKGKKQSNTNHDNLTDYFRVREHDGVKIDKKLKWLRSQIVGGKAVFGTPFGERRLTYADHTASGRCLHYVEDYIAKHVLPFYGNSHTSDSYVGHRTTKMDQEASEYIKKCLGSKQDDALIFCGSGTTSAIKRLQEVMGISIPSILRERVLKILSNEEKWVVFVGPFEHHSNILSWRQSLCEVIEIGLNEDGSSLDMEALRLKLEYYQSINRPILGSFSACSNVTGIYSDTRAIARLIHRYGGFACFDFAASGPYIEIDMRSGEIDGYDAIFLSPHKFIGGPGSPGILLMTNDLYQLKSSPPSTCGGGTVDFVNGFNEKDTLYVKNIEEREKAGTQPIIQKIKAALAFWVKEYIGYQEIEKQEQYYIKKSLERLIPNKNIWVLGNTRVKRQAIISFLIHSNNDGKRDKPLHGPFVAKLLNDLFGIQARGGCACAGPYGHSLLNIDEAYSLSIRLLIQMGYNAVKPGWTRISFPYYMSNEEFEFILDAVEFIANYGQRFLPLYHLNWTTGAWSFKKSAFNDTLQGKGKKKLISPHSLFANLMKTQNINGSGLEPKNTTTNKIVEVIDDYKLYLQTAEYIASFLPKFPSQRRVPQDIDINLLPYKV